MSSKHSDLLTTQYARDAVAGRIVVSKKVRQACERHLRDLEQQGTDDFPWVFDEEKGFRPIDVIQRFCKPSKGNYKRLELQNRWMKSIGRNPISSSVPCTVGSTKTPGSAGLRRGSFLLPGRMGNQRWCLAWPTMDVPKTERKARMSIYWPTA